MWQEAELSDRVANGQFDEDDWLISANSRQILPPHFLQKFAGQALNMHPGLLPQYAGLHCHQWAIRNGAEMFGATIHYMQSDIDTGAIVATESFAISPQDTGLSLFLRTLKCGSRLVSGVVEKICTNVPLTKIEQNLDQRHLYRHRDALDPRIDWSWPAQKIIDFIRAGNYVPFASPTYTAELDQTGHWHIMVLRARLSDRTPVDQPRGHIIDLTPDGPEIICGDGKAIVINRAQAAQTKVSLDDWNVYLTTFQRPWRQRGRDPRQTPSMNERYCNGL